MLMSLVVLTAFCDAITMVSVFFMLQKRPFLQNQCRTFLRSSLTLCSAKSMSLELECILVSSAYNETLEVWHAFNILLMWMLNNIGPKTDPCGTPKERSNRAEIASLKTTHCDLSER